MDAGDGDALAAEFAGDFSDARRVFDEPDTVNAGTGAPIDMGAFE